MFTLLVATLAPIALVFGFLHWLGGRVIAKGEYDTKGRKIKHPRTPSPGDFSDDHATEKVPAMAARSTLGEEVRLPGLGAYLPATDAGEALTDPMIEQQAQRMIEQALAYAYAQGMADAQPKPIPEGCKALVWDGQQWERCDGTANRKDGLHTCGKSGVK